MNRRDELLNRISELPVFPPALIRLMALLRNPDASINEIVKIIQLEPALTLRVLRFANSAYWGLPGTVTTIRDAVLRLGFRKVYEAALASGVMPLLSRDLTGYGINRVELWRHSVGVAIAAKEIAKRMEPSLEELAFTAGLLHDTGKLLMDALVERSGNALKTHTSDRQVSFDEAELTEFEISQAELGSEILTRWRLPEEIVNAVRYHLHPEWMDGDNTLAGILHLANSMILMAGIGAGTEGLQFRVDPGIMARFKMGPAGVAELMNEVHSRLLEATDIVNAQEGN